MFLLTKSHFDPRMLLMHLRALPLASDLILDIITGNLFLSGFCILLIFTQYIYARLQADSFKVADS